MITHWCVVTICDPHQADRYRALCGYEAEIKKEFRFDSMERVTCVECLRHVSTMRTTEGDNETRKL